MHYKTNYTSSIGEIMLASDGDNLTGLWLTGQQHFASTLKGPIKEDKNLKIFIKTKNWLDRYFAKETPLIKELNLAPSGSEFRQKVWKLLCDIPYGRTVSYGDIAKTLAKQAVKPNMSARAVGSAVGHNPISIIIPCHRVIGSGGNLTGYAGGIDKKIKLLELECVDISKLFLKK